jgi:hypothetical protein
MNVLQMKPMLGISIGIDPIGSGFVHDSFLLLVEELLAYQRESKKYHTVCLEFQSTNDRYWPATVL